MSCYEEALDLFPRFLSPVTSSSVQVKMATELTSEVSSCKRPALTVASDSRSEPSTAQKDFESMVNSNQAPPKANPDAYGDQWPVQTQRLICIFIEDATKEWQSLPCWFAGKQAFLNATMSYRRALIGSTFASCDVRTIGTKGSCRVGSKWRPDGNPVRHPSRTFRCRT